MRFRPKLYLVAVLAFALPAHADGPVLHEYISPDAAEDLRMGATTQDGTMPAAIDTPGGVLAAPTEPRTSSAASQVAYGGSATPDSIDASYRIDRDTSRPDAVRYDDPFIPAVTPFKRLYAYDGLDEGFELVVHDKQLRPLPIGGDVRPDDDQFYGDLYVDIVPGVPVRIPSVGPGARVLVARVEPALRFELQRDGADNWFIVGDARKRVRLVLELSIARRVFGSEFGEVSWSELARSVPALPPSARTAASEVLRAAGVSQAQRPADAVRALVNYFRTFAPSDDSPRASSGSALYSELALSKKGVCRHRAYAFVITALALGVPARLVRNEAHAWVEVWDGFSWHRVDLGGAASHLDYEQHSSEHQHQPPADPYQWPPGSEAGQSLTAQAAGPGGAGTGSPGAAASGASPRAPSRDVEGLPSSAPEPPTPRDAPEPQNEVAVSSEDRELRRGARFHVTGTARGERGVCANSRVDIALRDKAGVAHWLGALATDQAGKYDGRVALPFDLEVGDYSVIATTPRTAQCSGNAH
ncbi:MAG TPA: transglutaminase-like domain-containing protein [Polyangiaceae bacterium]|nr:transglutaminase-like domain-containing protein [Polyangiaceae bacterium]